MRSSKKERCICAFVSEEYIWNTGIIKKKTTARLLLLQLIWTLLNRIINISLHLHIVWLEHGPMAFPLKFNSHLPKSLTIPRGLLELEDFSKLLASESVLLSVLTCAAAATWRWENIAWRWCCISPLATHCWFQYTHTHLQKPNFSCLDLEQLYFHLPLVLKASNSID